MVTKTVTTNGEWDDLSPVQEFINEWDTTVAHLGYACFRLDNAIDGINTALDKLRELQRDCSTRPLVDEEGGSALFSVEDLDLPQEVDLNALAMYAMADIERIDLILTMQEKRHVDAGEDAETAEPEEEVQ
jgi:hypothetical protein